MNNAETNITNNNTSTNNRLSAIESDYITNSELLASVNTLSV